MWFKHVYQKNELSGTFTFNILICNNTRGRHNTNALRCFNGGREKRIVFNVK